MTTRTSPVVISARVLVCFLIVLLLTGVSSAERRLPAERGTGRGPYVYPIVPGTPAWEALDSHDVMVEATTIPEEYLAQMRTPALVATVRAYPLFWDAFFYNNTQLGMDAVAEQSNAVAELFRREDAGRVLLGRYRQMRVPNVALSDDAAMQLITDFTLIETLLAQEPILTSLTSDERAMLLDESMRVVSEKVAQPDVFGGFSLERTALVAGRVLYAGRTANDPAIDAFLRDATVLPGDSLTILFDNAAASAQRPSVRATPMPRSQDYISDKYVKTPRGTKVTVIVRTWDFTDKEKKRWERDFKEDYPHAVVEGSITRMYNCHAYAWHRQSLNLPYWMKTPWDDLYWTDKSYVKITSAAANKSIPKDVPNGSKVAYPGSVDHSAIKISATEFRSKWGEGPLVRHKPNYTPYGCAKCTLSYYRLR